MRDWECLLSIISSKSDFWSLFGESKTFTAVDGSRFTLDAFASVSGVKEVDGEKMLLTDAPKNLVTFSVGERIPPPTLLLKKLMVESDSSSVSSCVSWMCFPLGPLKMTLRRFLHQREVRISKWHQKLFIFYVKCVKQAIVVKSKQLPPKTKTARSGQECRKFRLVKSSRGNQSFKFHLLAKSVLVGKN